MNIQTNIQQKVKKVAVLGGGTGSYIVLNALKKYNVKLRSIVAMVDSGGSTGALRDQLGVLPPGDLRQCFIALSDAPELWRKLFAYRFEKGDLKGHTFGNIFISALQKTAGSYNEALEEVHYVLKCKGKVHPVGLTQSDIHVKYSSGRVIESEKLLDEQNPDNATIVDAQINPKTAANPNAIKSILSSDYIIAGPGDLYSSLISIALFDGIKDAIKKSKAKIIFNVNLMTKSSQSYRYKASNHVADFVKYFGRRPDICIVNSTPITHEMAAFYEKYGEEQVQNDLNPNDMQIIEADILDTNTYAPSEAESLAATFAHSIVRHDQDKLEQILKTVIGLSIKEIKL